MSTESSTTRLGHYHTLMALSEADTRAKLIDPQLYSKGWTEEHIKREETAGTILVINGKGKQRKGTTDYTLRNKFSARQSREVLNRNFLFSLFP